MEDSLLYKLVMNKIHPDVMIDPNRFREVFRSQYGKVRIYKVMSVSKESKDWVANPANRVCDAPGSWFCRGQYPPALEKILMEKKDFKQLEDFNARGEDDSEYQKQYLENLKKGGGIREDDRQKRRKEEKKRKKTPRIPTAEEIEELNDPEQWSNSEFTTTLWNLISNGQTGDLKKVLDESPAMAHLRSEDGRGPMWWAHEYGMSDIVALLKSHGVSDERKDKDGTTPLDISKS
jgi:dolichyl-diphosphooligosaccharide---protein glycosyltransferase